jgi:hypothetical protein
MGWPETQASKRICPGRKPHSPEIAQGLEGFEANFPKIAIIMIIDPNHAKFGGLLRKTVREFHDCTHRQCARHSDHRAVRAYNPCMRVFPNRASIFGNSENFDWNPHDYTSALPLPVKLQRFAQAIVL